MTHQILPATLQPDWLAHRYDPGNDAVHFVLAPREVRRRAAFLTDQNLSGAAEPLVLRRADALAMSGAGARVNFILHSAYCCSTLLANAYDREGACFSLKEPVLLNDLVGWRHRGGPAERIGAVLDDGLRLLAQPFRPGEVCVVKPSNVVNGLGPAMMSARPEAAAVLLFAPLELFVGSIAGKGLEGRLWVRELLLKLLKDGLVDLGFEAADYFGLTDLQVAAVGWLAQQSLFARLATAWPERVRTLDSEVLLSRPVDALAAIDRLFGIAEDKNARAAVLAGPFGRNAKTGASFDASDRAADQRRASELHSDEIEKVVAWATLVAERAGVTMEPPGPLLGAA